MPSGMTVLFDLVHFMDKKEDLLDIRKLNVLKEGNKSKCFQMGIRARALKTKDGIMRNHNRKRYSGTGQRNGCAMTCLIGLVKLSICHACNTCLK